LFITCLFKTFFRFKNCYFRSPDAQKKAERKLLQLLKTEVATGPVSRQNSMELVEVAAHSEGLEAAFEAVKQNARRNEEGPVRETEEDVLKNFLNSKLETTGCLAWW
jgi:hypothetical protein